MTLNGLAKRELSQRLGNNWKDLAIVLDIPPYEQDKYSKGEEVYEILRWLDDRNESHRLPNALEQIERPDLLELLPDEENSETSEQVNEKITFKSRKKYLFSSLILLVIFLGLGLASIIYFNWPKPEQTLTEHITISKAEYRQMLIDSVQTKNKEQNQISKDLQIKETALSNYTKIGGNTDRIDDLQEAINKLTSSMEILQAEIAALNQRLNNLEVAFENFKKTLTDVIVFLEIHRASLNPQKFREAKAALAKGQTEASEKLLITLELKGEQRSEAYNNASLLAKERADYSAADQYTKMVTRLNSDEANDQTVENSITEISPPIKNQNVKSPIPEATNNNTSPQDATPPQNSMNSTSASSQNSTKPVRPDPSSQLPGNIKPLEPKMVLIKGGCFLMGSPEKERGRRENERQHEVCVDDFYMGQYEVTVAEYSRFASRNSSGDYFDKSGADYPVNYVTWYDAMTYAEWLSEKTGNHYRLPTEAEWEYAARANTATAYYWGDDPDQACRYANVNELYFNCDDRFERLAPIGQFKANPFELFDMLGNVWEWTCSGYDGNYGGREKECLDKGISDYLPVRRGGSWDNDPRYLRSAVRNDWIARVAVNYIGFRLARTP